MLRRRLNVDDHDGLARPGDRAQLLDALDGVDDLLDLAARPGSRPPRRRRPGSSVRTLTVGRSTEGKRSTPSRAVGGRADHDQREDEHGGEDRPADADLGELLHRLGRLLTRHGLAAGEVAGLGRRPGCPAVRPATISTRSPSRRPVCTRISAVLSVLARVSTFSTPAKVTMAVAGTVTIAFVRLPPRSRPWRTSRAGAAALVRHLGLDEQGAVLLADRRGEAGDRAPCTAVGSPSTLTSTRLSRPHAGRLALGHGQPEPQRVERTRVTTGAPAARYSPADARRSLTAPSIGERPRRGRRAAGAPSSSSERRWSSTAWPDCAPPRARPGTGPRPPRGRPPRLSSCARGDEPLLPEPLRALAGQLRLVEHGARLPDEGGLLDIHAVVGSVGRQPEPSARLLERGHRLVDAELGSPPDRAAPRPGRGGRGCRGPRASRRRVRPPSSPRRPARPQQASPSH